MVIVEKNKQRLNVLEFLLWLADQDKADTKYSQMPKAWQEMVGERHIVYYYVGKDTFAAHQQNPVAICNTIEYVCNSVESTDVAALFWYDDGALQQTIEYLTDSTEKQKSEWTYKCLVEKLEEMAHVQRIELSDADVALKFADTYYGDESPIVEVAKNKELSIVFQASKRQYMHEALDLPVWLQGWLEDVPLVQQSSLTKADNRRRVLYYMNPQALLSQGERALSKLEDVIAIAKARPKIHFYWAEQKDYARYLHLLSESKRQRYMTLRQDFASVATLLPIEICGANIAKKFDIYYGDESDCLSACIKLRKPVVHQAYVRSFPQNLASKYRKESFGVQFLDGCWVGDYYYFSSFAGNALCRVAKDSENVEFVAVIPCKTFNGRRSFLFSTIAFHNGKLFLLPLEARCIMIYDLTTSAWKSLPLCVDYFMYKKSLFFSGVRIGNVLWGIPACYGAIICLDMDTEEISYYGEWCKEVKSFITNPGSIYWSGVAALASDKLYFLASQSTHVISFDLNSKKSDVYKVDVEAQGLGNISYDGKDFWITTGRKGCGQLLRWRPDTGVTLAVKDIMGEPNLGCVAYLFEGFIYAFTYAKDLCVKFNPVTGTSERIEHYLPEDLRSGLGIPWISLRDGIFYIYPYWGELFVKFNPATEKVETKCFRFNASEQKAYIEKNFLDNEVDEALVSDDNELAVYFENCSLEQVEKLKAGERIYRDIIELCEQ